MKLKKTKIICTIGPASSQPRVIKQMIEAGMDAARLNFSHGKNDEKRKQIKNIREISGSLGKPVAVIADLQGPKIRLGEIVGVKTIRRGQAVEFSIRPSFDQIPIQFDFSEYIKVRQRIFLNDGAVELKVLKAGGGVIRAKALNSGSIASNKGINIPDTHLKIPAFTKKDLKDLEFVLDEGVEYVALSFVQKPKDIVQVRREIQRLKGKAKIIVKIEKKEAVLRLEAIIKEADAVMVARGDLAIETKPSAVPIIQNKIIRLCHLNQKPVIIATQMLESMVEKPSATRAEVSDVANAVADKVDAVMLSAETAAGKFPVEAVKVMNDVILSVEENPDFKYYGEVSWPDILMEELHFNAIASAAVLLSQRIGYTLIAVATATGRAARLISSFRPDSHIVAITHDSFTQNQLNLIWGIHPIVLKPANSTDLFWDKIKQAVRDNKFARKGTRVVMIGGSLVGVSGATDTIKVATI